MKDEVWMTRENFFFFRERQRVGRRNKFWKQVCGTPGGCKWRHSFLACVRSIAVSSPQADTCGFNPPYTERLLHYICISFFPPKPLSCVSSSKSQRSSLWSHFWFLWQQSSFLSQNAFPFHISHIPCQHLYYIVSPFCFPPHFISPEHISVLVSLWNLWNIFLQEHHNCVTAGCVAYLSHPTAFERVMPKTSPFSRDVRLRMCDCVSVVGVVS